MFGGNSRLPVSIMGWKITTCGAQLGKADAQHLKMSRTVIRNAKRVIVKIFWQAVPVDLAARCNQVR
jgi:hypothetical protein|tara:strand:- start:184 stop:384 length:201 start_codon:yes stop_codon:yes gene_type:complete